jgi:DNA-binding NarL/FixJ family response regulator
MSPLPGANRQPASGGASTMGAGPCWWEDRIVNNGPHSVLVVDDQAPFRAAAKAVLRRLDCFELAAEAASGPEAIELVDTIRPELVLMDINMPQMSGITATREIVLAHPDTIVFLCSTYDASDLPADAAASGARAYLNKERFSGDALRQLWQKRDSGAFVSL